jgi:hypothetical protein
MGQWRRLGRVRDRSQVLGIASWLIALILFGLTLNLGRALGDLGGLALPLGVAAAIGCLVLGTALAWSATWVAARLFWPPSLVGAPPEDFRDYTAGREDWVRPPAIRYPFVARARRQCGWVALRILVDARGRVQSYQIADQAPAWTFERAVLAGLGRGVLVAVPEAPAPRETKTLITFVSPGAASPEWALQRLPPARKESA